MKKAALILTAACLPTTAAMAGPSFLTSTEQTPGPGYTYFEGDYIPDGPNLRNSGHDYNGFGFEGSYQFPYHLFFNARYDRLYPRHSGASINRGHAGIGYEGYYNYGALLNFLPGTGIGYYITANYERLGFHGLGSHGANVSGNGVGGTLGLRWMVLPGVELNPTVGYNYYPRLSGDGAAYHDTRGLNWGVRGVGYLTPHFALTAAYKKTNYNIGPRSLDFDNEVHVGVRYTF
jgi:hypothetical protein